MSVIDYCKKLSMFSNCQLQVIKILIQQYLNNDETFAYLKDINLNQVQFFWYKDSNQDVLGGFHFFGYSSKNQKYAIYINDVFNQQHNNTNAFSFVQLVFQTIVHELKHYWQMKKFGWVLYFVLQMPVIRQFTIQRQAKKVSQKIIDMKMSNLNTVEQFILKIKYNISTIYLSEQEKKLKQLIKQKNIDVVSLYQKQKFYSLRALEKMIK